MRISQKVNSVIMRNLRHIIFMWRQRYWKIFISALVYLSPFKREPHKMVTVADKLFECV